MNKSYPPRLRELSGCGIFSPKGFLTLALFFAVCHVVGLREHTAFISGTAASPDGSESSTMVFGVIYLCAYFGCVLLAPILVLAATILFAWQRQFAAPEPALGWNDAVERSDATRLGA